MIQARRLTTLAIGSLVALGLSAPAHAQDAEPRLLGQPVPREIHITGGGPVIQILPGPAPFAQRALRQLPPEKRQEMRPIARMGPFSNNVATISGSFDATFTDRGASGDAVRGTSEFTTQDGTQWRVVLTGVDPTGNPPMAPHWGGVATYRPLHGTSGNHNPFVPTVNSIAMWGTADVFRNGQQVKDEAPIHIMLTSDTRGEDFKYKCYDCVGNDFEELHLILMPKGDTGKYQAPGGFLHVMWEAANHRIQPVT